MAEQRELQTDNYRRSIRLNNETYSQLVVKAKKEHITVAALMRKYINNGLSAAYYEENDGKVRQMIREEVDTVMSGYIERMIKVQLKGTKASAAALYALINLLAANMMSESSAEDILANAFKQSCNYMKQKEKTDADYRKEAKEFMHTSTGITRKDDY